MADVKSCEENNNCLLKLIFWFEECVCQSYTWHTLLQICVCHGIHGIHGSAAYACLTSIIFLYPRQKPKLDI